LVTIQKIQQWCSQKGHAVHGVMRGAQFEILPSDPGTDFPEASKVLHWLVCVADKRYALSPSDMEKVLEGKLDLEFFIKSAHSRSRADA
jgi:hypothetical protein